MSSPIKWFVSITKRGDGVKFAQILSQNGASNSLQMLGKGTAPNETLNLLGLGDEKKDIILGTISENAEKQIFDAVRLQKITENGNGIAFTMPLSSISLAAAKLINENTTNSYYKEEFIMNDNYRLAVAVLECGLSETAMEQARKFGAHGGTIVRSRDCSLANGNSFLGMSLHPEKEILFILAKTECISDILKNICNVIYEKTQVHCVCFSLPVDNALLPSSN